MPCRSLGPHPARRVRGVARRVSRPTPGRVPGPYPGGLCIPACNEADITQQKATAAGGTHPTGMHSC